MTGESLNPDTVSLSDLSRETLDAFLFRKWFEDLDDPNVDIATVDEFQLFTKSPHCGALIASFIRTHRRDFETRLNQLKLGGDASSTASNSILNEGSQRRSIVSLKSQPDADPKDLDECLANKLQRVLKSSVQRPIMGNSVRDASLVPANPLAGLSGLSLGAMSDGGSFVGGGGQPDSPARSLSESQRLNESIGRFDDSDPGSPLSPLGSVGSASGFSATSNASFRLRNKDSIWAQKLEAEQLITEEQRKDEVASTFFSDLQKLHADVVLLVCLFNFIVVPVRVGLGSRALPDELRVVELVIDLLSLAVVSLNFILPFERKGQIVYSKKETAWHYLTGSFLFHMLALFPAQVIVWGMGREYDHERINRMLLAFEYPPIFSRVVDFHFPRTHPNIARIVKFSVGLMSFVNMMAAYCTILLVNDPVSGQQWSTLDIAGTEDLTLFFFSWKWMLELVSGRNLPYPVTDEHHAFLVPMSFVGFFINSVVIAAVTQMIVQLVERASKLQTKIDKAILEIQRVGLPTDFRDEVVMYYRRMWELCKTFDYNESEDILSELSRELREEVEFAINVDVIQNVPMFLRVANDEGFINAVAESLVPIVVLPGAPIVTKGDDGNAMFFIFRGSAAVLGPEYQEIAVLNEGAFFGEIVLLFGGKRTATILASTLCQVYSLTRQRFSELIDRYPQALEGILQSALLRYSKQRDDDEVAAALTPDEEATGEDDDEEMFCGGNPLKEAERNETSVSTRPHPARLARSDSVFNEQQRSLNITLLRKAYAEANDELHRRPSVESGTSEAQSLRNNPQHFFGEAWEGAVGMAVMQDDDLGDDMIRKGSVAAAAPSIQVVHASPIDRDGLVVKAKKVKKNHKPETSHTVHTQPKPCSAFDAGTPSDGELVQDAVLDQVELELRDGHNFFESCSDDSSRRSSHRRSTGQ